MDRPDIPLNALRTFEVAMRQGSFTRAAIELRVTQAAVSHQIARLEDLLGTALFLRTSAGLKPTEEALALFPEVERSLDAMARSLDRVAGRHSLEVLKLGVVATFALGWLLPRLPDFQRAHPQIDLRLTTHNNRVDILREGLDMAVRFGAGRWPGLESQRVMEAPMAPLCVPALAAGLTGPANLGRLPLLRSYRANEWEQWFAAVGAPCPPLTGPMFDSSLALAEAAEMGAGVALLPVPMFARRIAAGRLVQPFDVSVSAGDYHLTWPGDRPMTAAMERFAAWAAVEASPARALR